jgi:membrane protease YdiL (CAAX protease family)
MQVFSVAVVGLVIVSSAILWRLAWERGRAGLPLLPSTVRPLAPWGLLDLGLAAFIWLVVNLAVMEAASRTMDTLNGKNLLEMDPEIQQQYLLLSSAATLVVCLLVAGTLWLRHRVTWRELGWDPRLLASDLVTGAKAFAMLAPVVYGLQILLTQFVESKHPVIEQLKLDPSPQFFLVAGFAAVIVAPLAEVFLFRVLLQGWLERAFARPGSSTDQIMLGGRPKETGATSDDGNPANSSNSAIEKNVPKPSDDNPYSPPVSVSHSGEFAETNSTSETAPSFRAMPILGSSLCFALSHWSHGPDPIPLFVLAVGLGYLYQRTGRLAPCVMLHFLLNLCSLAALWTLVAQ